MLDIINDLVLATNLYGHLINSDLELAALILHKTALLTAVLEVRMATPRSGSDNTPSTRGLHD